ncbi:MAG: hypothetical protein AAGG75_23665 [Bacteroidota bacterium]
MTSNTIIRILFSKFSHPAYLVKCTLLLLFFVSAATVSEAQCPPAEPGCTPTQTFTATVNTPNYPDCNLTVTYDLRVCQGEFQIFNIRIVTGTGDCFDFISDVLGIFFGPDPTLLNQERFLATLIEQIETEVANQLFDAAVAAGPAILYNCNSGLNTFTAKFYRGSCVSFCVTRNSETGAIGFVPLSCGTTCCVKRTVYCLDDAGNVQVDVTVDQVIPGECFTLPRPTCPAGSLFQSPCFELCETN